MMKTMTRVTIALPPRPYDAVIENGLLQRSGETLRDLFSGIFTGDSPGKHQRLFVVTVPPVRRKWGKKLMSSLSAAGIHRKDRGNAQRRTPQKAGHGRKIVRAIEPPGRGPQFRHHRLRRRRGGRRHRPGGIALHARRRPGTNPHHGARASGRLHRRQDRRQPARGKKSGRHISPPAAWS